MVFQVFKRWLVPVFGTLFSSRIYSRKLEDETPPEFRTFGGGGGSGPSWRGRGPPTANPITNVTRNESEERMVDSVDMHDMKSEKDLVARQDDQSSRHEYFR